MPREWFSVGCEVFLKPNLDPWQCNNSEIHVKMLFDIILASFKKKKNSLQPFEIMLKVFGCKYLRKIHKRITLVLKSNVINTKEPDLTSLWVLLSTALTFNG